MTTKVWLQSDCLLQENFTNDLIRMPAGTCLFIAEDQRGLAPELLRVYGAGIYDQVPLAWLSYEAPKEIPQLT